MKKVLFISKSKLSHNLLRALVPLVPTKTDLTCVEGVGDLAHLGKRGKGYQLVLADWNVFAGSPDLNEACEAIEKHPLLKGAKRILIHPQKGFEPDRLAGKGYDFYPKPFEASELAALIERGLKS